MQAATIKDGQIVVAERPDPEPGNGEVLVMGERVCVHGAAGGVGTAGVQLAASTGASVVATVRREEHRSLVAALGATAVAPDDFVERGPFDVILELVGAPNLAGNMTALEIGGRISIIGLGAGASAEINLSGLMM